MKCWQCEYETPDWEVYSDSYYCIHCCATLNIQPDSSKREDSLSRELLEIEDCLLRELLESSAVDISKIKDEPPYPLIWDKDFNFIGHKAFEEMRYSGHDSNAVREVQ